MTTKIEGNNAEAAHGEAFEKEGEDVGGTARAVDQKDGWSGALGDSTQYHTILGLDAVICRFRVPRTPWNDPALRFDGRMVQAEQKDYEEDTCHR